MTVKELIEQLKDLAPDTPVYVRYSENTCRGHEDGEYCYCPYEDKEVEVDAVIYEDHVFRWRKKVNTPPKVILTGY